MVELRRYTDNFRSEWNNLVELSINGTFLHKRQFIDYHGGRFADFSLMAFSEERLVAVFPAEVEQKTFYSHRGLSYGSWIFALGIESEMIRAIILEGFAYLRYAGIDSLYIRSIPAFYFASDYHIIRDIYRSFGTVVATKTFQTLSQPFSWQDRGRRWGLQKALKSGLSVSADSSHLDDFWEKVLSPNLWERHQVNPVHSLSEMRSLMAAFPSEIKLYTIIQDKDVLAGVLVFETKQVAHAQYIANGPSGRRLRALDLLMHHLLTKIYSGIAYFSLGISDEPKSGAKNAGLYDWKKSLGANDFVESDFQFQIKLSSPDA